MQAHLTTVTFEAAVFYAGDTVFNPERFLWEGGWDFGDYNHLLFETAVLPGFVTEVGILINADYIAITDVVVENKGVLANDLDYSGFVILEDEADRLLELARLHLAGKMNTKFQTLWLSLVGFNQYGEYEREHFLLKEVTSNPEQNIAIAKAGFYL